MSLLYMFQVQNVDSIQLQPQTANGALEMVW